MASNPIQTIPNLPPAIALAGPEQFWINQAGVDMRAGLVDVTSYVAKQLGFAGPTVTSFNARYGDVVLTAADVAATGFGVGSFIPVTGGSMSGSLTISPGSGDAYIVLNKRSSGPADYIQGSTAGLARWRMILGDNTPESGANTGSNLQIQACADDGSIYANWVSISRATGTVTMGRLVGTTGAVIDNFTLDAGSF